MKALIFSRLCLVGMLIVGLAVGLFIESSVWSPHVLRGKELLNVGGLPDCIWYKSPAPNQCEDHCPDGDTHDLCTGDEGTATVGCYTMENDGICGDSSDPKKTCTVLQAGVCEKCS